MVIETRIDDDNLVAIHQMSADIDINQIIEFASSLCADIHQQCHHIIDTSNVDQWNLQYGEVMHLAQNNTFLSCLDQGSRIAIIVTTQQARDFTEFYFRVRALSASDTFAHRIVPNMTSALSWMKTHA